MQMENSASEQKNCQIEKSHKAGKKENHQEEFVTHT